MEAIIAVIGTAGVVIAALIAAIVQFERMRRENSGSHGEVIEVIREARADIRELRRDVRDLKRQQAYDAKQIDGRVTRLEEHHMNPYETIRQQQEGRA